MDTANQLSVDEASRLAVTATVTDLEFWARCVAVHGQVNLKDLLGWVEALGAASAPQRSAPAHIRALAAS